MKVAQNHDGSEPLLVSNYFKNYALGGIYICDNLAENYNKYIFE